MIEIIHEKKDEAVVVEDDDDDIGEDNDDVVAEVINLSTETALPMKKKIRS